MHSNYPTARKKKRIQYGHASLMIGCSCRSAFRTYMPISRFASKSSPCSYMALRHSGKVDVVNKAVLGAYSLVLRSLLSAHQKKVISCSRRMPFQSLCEWTATRNSAELNKEGNGLRKQVGSFVSSRKIFEVEITRVRKHLPPCESRKLVASN